MRSGTQLPVLLAALLAVGAARSPAHGACPADPFPVAGELRVASCSSRPCPLPAPEDPRWSTFALGPGGIVGSLNQQEGLAWVVLRFTLPPGCLPESPALLITHPADAEEASLNGQHVDGRGVIGPYFATTTAGPRVLTLPRSSLREGENEFVLRSLLSGRNARFFTGPFLLGEQDRVDVRAARMRYPSIGTEAAFLSMFLVVFIFYGFLVVKRVIRSDYLYFMAFVACYAAEFFLGSRFLHQDGVVGPGFVLAQAVLGSARVLVLLALVTRATGSRFGVVFWTLALFAAGFTALDAALPPLTALLELSPARRVLSGITGVYYLVVSAAAVRRRREDSVPVLVGVACYVVGSRVDLFWGIPVRDYAAGAFALCMLFALTSRHARLRNRIEAISVRLLDAHEEERRRIARDIHDGVGQSLLALRLKLQQLAAAVARGTGVPREALDELAAEAGSTLEEVRGLSMDLRPSFIESKSLTELLRWYGATFAERRGLALRVHEPEREVPDPGSRVKDNLYRIYQETLSNVAKHAGASRVDVSLYREGRSLVLEVADDGGGFSGEAGAGGIGLETMQERAELVGGSCLLESAPGRGTRVRVEVPAP